VALARKLLVALWHYLERDEVPAGALEKTWEGTMAGRRRAPAET
jgi:hypothetical protein